MASLIAQRERIHLPVRGTQVRSLVWEDPTGCGATKSTWHNCWACALESTCHDYGSPHALEPVVHNQRSPCKEKPSQWEGLTLQLETGPRLPQQETSPRSNEDPAQLKNKKESSSNGLKSEPPVAMNMTFFANRVFADAIKLRWSQTWLEWALIQRLVIL